MQNLLLFFYLNTASKLSILTNPKGDPLADVFIYPLPVPCLPVPLRPPNQTNGAKQGQCQIFSIPETEQLLDDFCCALKKKVLLQVYGSVSK